MLAGQMPPDFMYFVAPQGSTSFRTGVRAFPLRMSPSPIATGSRGRLDCPRNPLASGSLHFRWRCTDPDEQDPANIRGADLSHDPLVGAWNVSPLDTEFAHRFDGCMNVLVEQYRPEAGSVPGHVLPGRFGNQELEAEATIHRSLTEMCRGVLRGLPASGEQNQGTPDAQFFLGQHNSDSLIAAACD